MERWLTVALSLLSMIAYAAASMAQSPDLTGEWEVHLRTPRGDYTITAMIKQEGEKLSGEALGQNKVNRASLTGTIKGKDVKAVCTILLDGNNRVQITLTGKVEGDSVTGKADFGGFANGDWNAKRLPETASTGTRKAPAATTPSAEKIDLSGVWSFEVETETGITYPICTFKQEGETLTGQCKVTSGEAPLTGTLGDNEIKFAYKVLSQGTEVVITYTGTVEKNLMEGTSWLGETRLGTWKAWRQ
jgi:hypothetical protein